MSSGSITGRRRYATCIPPPVSHVAKGLRATFSAVFPQQPAKLRADLRVKLAHVRHVRLGVLAHVFATRVQQPVGEAAVARLTVRPRAEPREAEEPVLFAKLDERAQIAVARPIPL